MIVLQLTHIYIKYLMLVLVYAGYSLANTTLADVEMLFNDTILSIDHRLRPTLNQNKPTVVYLSLELLYLADVDEVQQSISTNVLLTVSWQDEVRKWNSTDYGGLTKVRPDPSDIWRPRLYLSNSNSERDMFKNNYAPLTIYNTGLTEWFPGGILHTTCSMKMAYFPFDTQTCTFTFMTGESTNKVELEPASSTINLNRYYKNGEWVILNSEAISVVINDKSYVKFILQIRRLSSFTMISTVVPLNVISSLSSLVFILPLQCGERVSFSITVLLSLTVYTNEISKDLPTNSESMPILIMYLTSFILHSGLAIVANLIVLIRRYPSVETIKKDQTKSSNITSLSHSDFTINDFEMVEPQSQTNRTFKIENIHSFHNFNQNANQEIDRTKQQKLAKNNKLTANVGSSHNKYVANKNSNNGIGDIDCKTNLFKLIASRVFNYINIIDFIMFVLFFVVWLVLTIVFMSLITCCTLQN